MSVPLRVLPPQGQPHLALIPYPSWDLKDGLDEGQLGEKAVWPACLLLLVTLPWGAGAFCRYQPSFHGVDLSALRGAAVDEYFRQPVVVSAGIQGTPGVSAGRGPHLGWQEGSFLVRPVQAVRREGNH